MPLLDASLSFFLLQADTTSLGYKVGYEIGSWLPFILLAILLWLMIRSLRHHKKED